MSGTGILLAVIAAALAAWLLRAFWEPTQLTVTWIRLWPGQDKPPVVYEQRAGSLRPPDERYSSAASDPNPVTADHGQVKASSIRILFFSDLHMDGLKIRPRLILDAAARLQPDLVLFGGDLTAKDAALPAALDLIRRLRQQTNEVSLIAVPGNHDTDESLQSLREAGVVVLQNTHQTVLCRGLDWQVIGLEDSHRGVPDPVSALRQPEDAAIHSQPGMAIVPALRRLVLVHNPDTLLLFPPGQAATFLSGHFHGGQIWMPFRLEFRLLRQEKLPRLGLYKGCIQWGDMTGAINRGLGCVLLPLRFRSKPELTLMEIHAE